ncbi:hypothetical protein J40TS1_48670 [Paenibacillus montaniterrae]|uniref:Uncharacterized protein n=1 Tax=Paenibacillus montaniterrae TaxID=429341 RepID=A0A919YTJ6_9BACL|nr:hypothetical protein [Paenibacillus montaniterrae]GIP19225.1 hypothetical protein J40TS1_48670 [Paenibacillus montaniterrae]
MKSHQNKWVIVAFTVFIISLIIWLCFFKVSSQTATIATLIAIDSDNKVMEIKTENSASIKIRYKKEIKAEIGKDYLIVYNNYKFRDPVLFSIKD